MHGGSHIRLYERSIWKVYCERADGLRHVYVLEFIVVLKIKFLDNCLLTLTRMLDMLIYLISFAKKIVSKLVNR
jgi:hypothetical protein